MTGIVVLSCKKVKDVSCIACAKCHKAMREKNGEYARHEEIDLVAMTDCGDCPGVLVPRVKQLKEMTTAMDRPFETVYLGTCVKLAMETSECPIDFEKVKPILEEKFGVEVVLGTHTY
jgi:predicted metal-binding protein